MQIVKRSATYRYRDEFGRSLFERVRWLTDQPPPRHKLVTYQYGIGGDWATGHGVGSGVIIKEKHPQADRYLYMLPEMLAVLSSTEHDIWWTEGESDANALAGYGQIAVSHHGGAGRATVGQAEWFRGFQGQVVLPFDRDEDDRRGGNVGALDVIRRYDLLRSVGLRADQLVVVSPFIGKDIQDHLDEREPEDVVLVPDIQFLRDKAVRTVGTTFGAAGYAPPDTEIAELFDQNPDWTCTVVDGEASNGKE